MPAELAWIPVQIHNGMFSSEWAVAIDTEDGIVSLFADKSIVRQEDDGSAFLQVTRMGRDADTGLDIMLLPTECIETGTRWLRMQGVS
jgi:hypothetical protein